MQKSLNNVTCKEDEINFIYLLCVSKDIARCFLGLVNSWNQEEEYLNRCVFSSYTSHELESCMMFFDSLEFANLANALFFYKLFPNQLEKNAHPEKLISLHLRLNYLHLKLLFVRQKLHDKAAVHGLKSGLDYFCSNNELPAGLSFQINPFYQSVIEEAVKLLKLPLKNSVATSNDTLFIDKLFAVYKFSFNPNRLIDIAMSLEPLFDDKKNLADYVCSRYQALSTRECIDLYGYFINKETRYFLYTFILTLQETTSFLPSLSEKQKTLIQKCFSIIQGIMEHLRVELKNRSIITEPYPSELPNKKIEIRKRNKLALLRIIDVYEVVSPEPRGPRLEQFFLELEASL